MQFKLTNHMMNTCNHYRHSNTRAKQTALKWKYPATSQGKLYTQRIDFERSKVCSNLKHLITALLVRKFYAKKWNIA